MSVSAGHGPHCDDTVNDRLFARACAAIPGGVNSPVRAFAAVGGTPRFMVSARGPYITDASGREYVDLVNSWGPAILGHAHPDVIEAVHAASRAGLSFGAPTPAEIELAELIKNRVTAVDSVRLVSTGTEATMTAIRLARGYTNRPLLIKFSGHYHGHSDGLLADAGSGLATFSLPTSAGVTDAVAAQTLVLPYNNKDAVAAAFDRDGEQIAAIIVEAAAANMGVVSPDPGFNAFLAQTAHRHGALFIVDEVLTGFRVGASGWWGLENPAREAEVFPVPGVASTFAYRPDLMTFGKVIGGGMPVAAVGGRAEVMDFLAPIGPVYQAGTLSGNPVAVAAGLATLKAADSDVYAQLDATASVVSSAVSDALNVAGVAHRVQTAANLFSIVFGDFANPVRTHAEVLTQEAWRYPAFFHRMLDGGVSLPPSVFESWFVSAAFEGTAIERLVDALPAAAIAAATARPSA